jgi:predicted AlkP superfamily phosphohydrolase/phosphomutase
MKDTEHAPAGAAQPSRKVMVISLDGATWDILQPWMDEGVLPHLAELVAGGAAGQLDSTIPPVTAPAWTTFQTGVQPGKHGLFHFTRYQRGSYETALVDATSIGPRTLWRILSDAGRRLAIVNVPVTYPPQPVNGVVVAGLLSPSPRQAFWPPDLYDEVIAATGEYEVFTPVRTFDYLGVQGFVEQVTALARGRARAARYIYSREDWDFFMVHFQSTDILQHALWAWVDPRHPAFADKPVEERAQARGFYQALDGLVGDLRAMAGADRTVIVMSDHGFGPVLRRLYLNQWLQNEGLLSAPGQSSLRGKLVGWAEEAVRRADVLKLRRRLIKPRSRGEGLVERVKRDALIQWPQTKAFALSGPFFGRIYINTEGREPQGTVAFGPSWDALRERIAEGLLALRDPVDGQPVVAEVWRREEVYHGSQADELPDLVVKPADGYQIVTEFRRGLLTEPMPNFLSGTHRTEGILALSGQGIRQGVSLQGASIADVAPTILHLMGLPVPRSMDGQVLQAAIEDPVLAARPVRFEEDGEVTSAGATATGEVYSEEDSAEVEARLAGLGYLS